MGITMLEKFTIFIKKICNRLIKNTLTAGLLSCAFIMNVTCASAASQGEEPISRVYYSVSENATNEIAFIIEENGDLTFGLTRLFDNGHMCGISQGTAQKVKSDDTMIQWLYRYEDPDIATEITEFTITYTDDHSVHIQEQNVEGSTGNMGVCGANAGIGEFSFQKSDHCGRATREMTAIITENTVCGGVGAPVPERE